MHRHLANEGETFSSLLDSVRSELATRYIDNRDRSLTTTAELLGFSALSAFSRWFRAKFCCSVSAWRAAQLAAPLANSRTGAGKAMS
jgi:AraC-like DNA-binding protein